MTTGPQANITAPLFIDFRTNQTVPMSSYFVSIADAGADPTGTVNNFGAIFNALMTKLSALGGGIRNGGTIYIPAGFYKIGSTQPVWQPFVSIYADPGAYIQADQTIGGMLTTGIGAANSVQYVSLIGGQWDGNGKVTQGFQIRDFLQVLMSDFRMYNCNSGSGGFIGLGDNAASNQNAITIARASMFNFGSSTPSIVSGNNGLFTDSTAGIANCFFDRLTIVGCQRGVSGTFASTDFDKIHTWCFASQGSMDTGFSIAGDAKLIQCEVDAPITSGNAGYTLASSSDITMVQCEFFEGTNNNISYAVNVGSGCSLRAMSNWWHGSSGSHLVLGDYTGTLANLINVGDLTLNVTTVHTDLPATATNDSAPAGRLGEYLTAFTSGTALTSGTPANVTSLSLTAGDWDVWAEVDYTPAVGTTATAISTSISGTSATENFGNMSSLNVSFPASAAQRFAPPHARFSLSTSTTVYAVINATFAVSTATTQGTLFARRRR